MNSVIAKPLDHDVPPRLQTRAPGEHIFSKRFGLGLTDRGYHAAVSPNGDIILAGDFHGAVDFGGGPLTSRSVPHTFLARFDQAGHHIHSRLLGTTGMRRITAVAAAAQGHCIVLGQFRGLLDLGGRPLRSRSREALFVARFNPSGDVLWSRCIDGEIAGRAIAMDGADHVLVTGYFTGAADFGLGPSKSRGGEDAFLLKLDAHGNPIGCRQFGGPKGHRGYRLAIGPENQTILTGYFEGTADFGTGPLQSPHGWALFIARFSAAGDITSAHHFDDASVMRGHAVGADRQGHVILAGHPQDAAQPAANPLHPGRVRSIFVTKLDGSANPLYLKHLRSAAIEYRQGLAVDADGCAIVTGHVLNAVTSNGQPDSSGRWSLFVTKLDPAGHVVWSRRFSATGGHFAQRVGVCAEGAIVLTGYFDTGVDLGGGPLCSGEGGAIFLAKLAP
jgi:hypothetical protein